MMSNDDAYALRDAETQFHTLRLLKALEMVAHTAIGQMAATARNRGEHVGVDDFGGVAERLALSLSDLQRAYRERNEDVASMRATNAAIEENRTAAQALLGGGAA